MNVIIVGDGKVGAALATQLSSEGHDVTIIDSNPQALSESAERLDVMAVTGNGASMATLREAGVERAEVLGYLTAQYANCICVCGTHGKTTVTAMLTQMLLESGLDPTAVIGGKLPLIGGNGRSGKSDLMVCEACEFADHFLQLSPDVAVILNVDADHLEYFGSLENIIHSFHRFAEMTSRTLIVNGSDPNTMQAIEGIPGKEVITFGWEEACD